MPCDSNSFAFRSVKSLTELGSLGLSEESPAGMAGDIPVSSVTSNPSMQMTAHSWRRGSSRGRKEGAGGQRRACSSQLAKDSSRRHNPTLINCSIATITLSAVFGLNGTFNTATATCRGFTARVSAEETRPIVLREISADSSNVRDKHTSKPSRSFAIQ